MQHVTCYRLNRRLLYVDPETLDKDTVGSQTDQK